MEKITSIQIAKRFGMDESLEDTIIARRLRWLGHLARMEDDRVPKKVLFGWLPQPRPPHGTKMRWRDRVRKDLRKFGIDERTWYTEAQERVKWKKWHSGLGESTTRRLQEDEQRNATRRTTRSGEQPANVDTPLRPFTCDTCKRSFRRHQDIARHKCITTCKRHLSQGPP